MNSAFSEDEDHSQDTPEIRDAWVLGAAQWILWNRQQLFKLVQWREELDTSSVLVERHRDEPGNPILRTDCWNDWKRGFERLLRPFYLHKPILEFANNFDFKPKSHKLSGACKDHICGVGICETHSELNSLRVDVDYLEEQLDWRRAECREGLDRLHDRLRQKTKEWEDDYWIFKNVSVSHEQESKVISQDLAALRKKKMERLSGESEPGLKEELAALPQEKKGGTFHERDQELSTGIGCY
ncbi:hypothetical protein ZTR_06854 [Talaromyces verruculosus]|nr:hypothetical protein ZTR_06854 [Talaromyces verruculosus]